MHMKLHSSPKTMTVIRKRYYGCFLVGMQTQVLGKVVCVANHIGLPISQLEFVQ